MIEIFVFVILVGMFFVDARLSRMVALQRAILEEMRKGNGRQNALPTGVKQECLTSGSYNGR